jgi:hypothetical protein
MKMPSHPQAEIARKALARGDKAYEEAARAMKQRQDDGLGQVQIAEQVGCSQPRVSRLLSALYSHANRGIPFGEAYAGRNHTEPVVTTKPLSEIELRALDRAGAERRANGEHLERRERLNSPEAEAAWEADRAAHPFQVRSLGSGLPITQAENQLQATEEIEPEHAEYLEAQIHERKAELRELDTRLDHLLTLLRAVPRKRPQLAVVGEE